MPKETGWFTPSTPISRRMPVPYDKLVSQTEDAFVDTRQRRHHLQTMGVLILRYTGPGESAPTSNKVAGVRG
jgi:hypothetical protein